MSIFVKLFKILNQEFEKKLVTLEQSENADEKYENELLAAVLRMDLYLVVNMIRGKQIASQEEIIDSFLGIIGQTSEHNQQP